MFYLYLIFRSWYEFESYIKESCEDLNNIRASYLDDTNKHFFVAEIGEGDKRKIVGCIGLGPMREDPQKICQVFRLVVSPEQRRLKVGTQLLSTLENYAVSKGFVEVRMIANNLLPDVHCFYMKNGYDVLYTTQRGLMRGDLIAYRKWLVPVERLSPKHYVVQESESRNLTEGQI